MSTESTDLHNTTLQRTYTGSVLLQAAEPKSRSDDRREYECVFMQPGRVKQEDQRPSNWLIPAQVIENAAHMFSSIPVHLDHPELFGFGWHQSPQVKNLAGVTFNAYWSDEEQALLGNIRLYDQEPGSPGAFIGVLMDQMLTDQANGLEIPKTGLSAVIFQSTIFDEEAGLRVTTAIEYAESMDIVYDAGAGGYARAALSAAGLDPDQPFRRVWQLSSPGGTNMSENNTQHEPRNVDGGQGETPPTPTPLDEAIAALNRVAQRIEQQHIEPEPEPETEPDDQITEMQTALATQQDAIERITAEMAAQQEPQTIQGMGDPVRLIGGRTGLDQVELALQAMVDGVRPPDGIRPLTGIRELYHLMSGDYEMSGVYQEDRVYLANVTASTMAQIVANVLNKRVMNIFQQYPQWWAPIVATEDFANLQQVRWITLGGIGELPTVAAGAAYTELTWDDLAQRDDFVKKGGYLGLTIEAIDKDDTRKITAAPRALAQAAWLTLSKSISAIFTANSGVGPDVYYDDSNQRALFHTSHSNLGTTALSWAAWDATRLAMRKQTELNSGERLGALTAPRFLLVPPDLETKALQYLASEGEPGTSDNDENPFAEGDVHSARMRAARSRVIVVDLWTETADWAAVADPNLWATIGLAFRYGRVPEIFSVADPRAGLMFSNDVMPIKVRFFYATGPIDYRGLYKHNP